MYVYINIFYCLDFIRLVIRFKIFTEYAYNMYKKRKINIQID